jgi:hypothetical protein
MWVTTDTAIDHLQVQKQKKVMVYYYINCLITRSQGSENVTRQSNRRRYYYEKKDLPSHFLKRIIELTCPQVENTSASFCSVTCRATRRKLNDMTEKHQFQSHFVRCAHMLINVRNIDGPPHTILPISLPGSAPHPPPPLVEAIPSLSSGRHGQFLVISPKSADAHTIINSIMFHSWILIEKWRSTKTSC